MLLSLLEAKAEAKEKEIQNLDSQIKEVRSVIIDLAAYEFGLLTKRFSLRSEWDEIQEEIEKVREVFKL